MYCFFYPLSPLIHWFLINLYTNNLRYLVFVHEYFVTFCTVPELDISHCQAGIKGQIIHTSVNGQEFTVRK